MSELIAARAKGDLLDRYQDERDKLHEDETESQLIRELLESGLDARRVPLAARLDVSNRVGARIENERERGEREEAVICRFLREAVDARDADALDAIGAGDELRAAVEDAREENEDLDDTVRRLARQGADAREERVGRLAGRGVFGTGVSLLTGAFAPMAASAALSPSGAWVLAAVFATLVLFALGVTTLLLWTLSNIMLARPLGDVLRGTTDALQS